MFIQGKDFICFFSPEMQISGYVKLQHTQIPKNTALL